MDDLTENERHHLLSNERRRTLLEVLDGRAAPIDIEDLAWSVAQREATDGDAAADAYRTVVVTLYHNHLPRLADHGLVDYDRASGRVVPAAPARPR